MIFVTVGTHKQSFNRLLEKVDQLIEENKLKEKIVMQIGHSSYEPRNAKWFRFTSLNKLKKFYKSARIIITHGGAGCILDSLSNGKPIIAVPRLKKFNEHVNDHQLDLVKALARHRRISLVYNINELEKVLSEVKKKNLLKPRKTYLCKKIKEFLESLEDILEKKN